MNRLAKIASKYMKPQNGHAADESPVTTPVVIQAEPDPGVVEPKPITAERPSIDRNLTAWQPFPVDALPWPVSEFVTEAASSLSTDPAFVAVPMLAALAGAIGSTRVVEPKPGWYVMLTLWCLTIGESGCGKSPALKTVLQFHRDQQRKLHDEWANGSGAAMPFDDSGDLDEASDDKPESPARCLVSDVTIEALCGVLRDNPRGLLLHRDEASGWLASMNKYSGKRGADESHWLSIYSGESFSVDRRTGDPRFIFVDNPSVSLTGGVQPGVLSRLMTDDLRESGMLARILVCYPPREQHRWTDSTVKSQTRTFMAGLFDLLFALEHQVSDTGRKVPVRLALTPDARSMFIDFVNRNGAEQVTLTGDLASAWSKLEEAVPKIAGVLHAVQAALAGSDELLIGPDVMRNAILLVDWFKGETRRVYGVLRGESREQRRTRDLVDWIAAKGGRVTARQIQQNRWAYREAGAAEHVLNDLVQAGLGSYETAEHDGHVSKVFILTASTPQQPQHHNMEPVPVPVSDL